MATGLSSDKIEALLGHRFDDPDLVLRALTHPSAGSPGRGDNQRLEFLGDRVLGLVVAETLMRTFPGLPEGELAPRLNALVRRETLAEVAGEIGLGAHLQLGRSESRSGGRRKAAILADALEAVIAALYLDGGIEAARAFVTRHWAAHLKTVRDTPTDAKTRLQEWAQGHGLPLPEYTTLARSGPDHAPRFRVAVRLSDGQTTEGEAGSKRQAEQEAAQRLLDSVLADG